MKNGKALLLAVKEMVVAITRRLSALHSSR
jgi:hypothetical protein